MLEVAVTLISIGLLIGFWIGIIVEIENYEEEDK